MNIRFQIQVALLIALMLAGMVAALTGPLRQFTSGWSPDALVGACFLIALEAGFVHHAIRRQRMDFGDMLRYLAPEIFIMVVMMRLAASLDAQVGSLQTQIFVWLRDPLLLFEPLFGLYVVAGVIIGLIAHLLNHDFGVLPPHPSETSAPRGSEERSFTIFQATDRSQAMERIVGRFLGGGMFLMLALGIESVNPNALLGPGKPLSAWSSTGAIVYIMSGVLLYSQGRLELLRARWTLDGAIIRETVPTRWQRLSWLVVALVVMLAALLPRSYGTGLLTALSTVMAWLIYAMAMLGYAVMWALGLVAMLPAWLMSLLSPGGVVAPPPTPAPPPALPPPPPGAPEPQPLALAIFWACVIALIVLAIRTILQRHPGILRTLLSFGPLAWLLRTIIGLWRDSAGWMAEAGRQTMAFFQPPTDEGPAARTAWLRLRSLTPRELIRYFYRSTLTRTAHLGLMRRPSQTPYEYAASLASVLPETRSDVQELTDAFVTAHYAPHPVDRQDAEQARKPWERLRRRLRALRHPPEQGVP